MLRFVAGAAEFQFLRQPMWDHKYKNEMRDGLGTIARSKSTRSMSMNDVGVGDLRRSLNLN